MTAEIHHEHVAYQNPFLAIKIWRIDSDREDDRALRLSKQTGRKPLYPIWNYHDEIEFLLILRGEMTAYYGDEQLPLRKGDVALFGSAEPHATVQTKDSPLSYLVFQLNLRTYWDHSTINNMMHFAEIIRPLSALNYIFRENREARAGIASLIRDIYKEMNDRQIGCELAVSSRIKMILLLLLRGDSRKLLHYHDHLLYDRLRPAIHYVEERLSEKLSVEAVSGLLNMSPAHFMKSFKKALGMTFTSFVVFKRIKRAEQLLLTSDISIADAAALVGMSNLGHFYQLFNRLNGCSPKQFRDRLRADAAVRA
ncbi:AraC family transcriptional regulator [Paenibacillus sacheonensis]|uniref:Helix-turn-helix domain-containing protein n=1 Tax=Paenibacillus sacheonensis TaxID=742054 RepID=A0A7X4YTX7_9BACL|nr:AraC family transcriptional regulator [Paenibacillus sacheonensis]MBM7568816.1 AraC-like DNA-binding protein/mannose-6-phosphate isomerase-like protein (cupin superfamily) [Paenibacillus sacheonensis]NBC72522.1 helix-turn-helix domain-containing protein [Paenibacillus sacheonensis]